MIQIHSKWIEDAIYDIERISSSNDVLNRLDELKKISDNLSLSASRISDDICCTQNELDYIFK